MRKKTGLIIKKLSPLAAPVMMLGVISQIGQVLILRELMMVFQGSEVSIGIILGAWMVWTGTGSILGGVLAERTSRPGVILRISAVIGFLLIPLTVASARLIRGFFNLLPGTYLSLSEMALASFAVMGPACLIIGAQFVLLAKLWRRKDKSRGSEGAGKTYAGEAAGNLAGGVIFTFLLVRYIDPLLISVLVAGFMLYSVFHLTSSSPRRTAKAVLPVLLGAVILFIPFSSALETRLYRAKWGDLAPGHTLEGVYNSKHGVISVLERQGQYSFFQSGHLVFSTAGPGTLRTGMEEQEAVIFAHTALSQHRDPRRVLLIGGGMRGILAELVKYPLERIDYVELDERLIKVARPYLSGESIRALSDERVRVIHTDGRRFVKSYRGESYDLIIADIPDPATAVLNRFYTGEFFREVRSILDRSGVFVTTAVSMPDLRGVAVTNRNAAIYHTLAGVFKRVLPAGERHLFFFAGDDPGQHTLEAGVLSRRFAERGIEAEGFSPHHFYTLLEDSHLRRMNWVLRNHGRRPEAHLEGPGRSPAFPPPLKEQELTEKELPPVIERYFINSDFRPIGYYYTLMFWERLTGTGRESFRRILEAEPRRAIFLFILAPLVAAGLRVFTPGSRKRPETRFGVLFAVFTTGLSTMALQIALIFSFQNIYGFVYEMIGLIAAIFMFGLGLGAHLSNRYVRDKANLRLLALMQALIAGFAFPAAYLLPAAAGIPSPTAVFGVFATLTFTAGLVNGFDFPLEAACYLRAGGNPERSAGAVYGTELFGACAGSVLAGAAVAPLMGISACFLLAGLAASSAFLVLLICRGTS